MRKDLTCGQKMFSARTNMLEKSFYFWSLSQKCVWKPLLDLVHINIYIYYSTFVMSDLFASHG